MKIKIFPDIYIDSIYDVDFTALYKEGYRAVIFDIDNTLVPHDAPADERAIEFFKYLHDTGFKMLLLSNNKEARVKPFAEAVRYATFLCRANKPSKKGFLKALQLLNVSAGEALFCGDQIFTDIYGANSVGIRNIMVKPVRKWKEKIQIVLKRFLEAPILLIYKAYIALGGEKKPVPKKIA